MDNHLLQTISTIAATVPFDIADRLAAQIDIVDDGPGIPPEIAETLFLPMVTAGTGGMGLGLSIAQSLINQHKGLIECVSRDGETTFTIFLPLDHETDDERQGEPNA